MSIRFDEQGRLLDQILKARGGNQQVLDSYDDFIANKIPKILAGRLIQLPSRPGFFLKFDNPFFTKPSVMDLKANGNQRPLWPRECRINNTSYLSDLFARVSVVQLAGNTLKTEEATDVFLGSVPVMIGSYLDHLYGLSEQEAYAKGEPLKDPKGYFIINGQERLLSLIEKLKTSFPLLVEKKEGYSVSYTAQTTYESTMVKISAVKIFQTSREFSHDEIHVAFDRLGAGNTINIFYVFTILGAKPEAALEVMETFIVDDDPTREATRRLKFRQYLEPTLNTFKVQYGNQDKNIYDEFLKKITNPNILNSTERNLEIINMVWYDLFKNIPSEGRTLVDLRRAKIRLLAMIVVKYGEFRTGYRKPDNRDFWGSKRITDSGEHMATEFTVIWKDMLKEIEEKIRKKTPRLSEIKNYIPSGKMRMQFEKAFVRGIWGATRSGATKDVAIVDILKRDTRLAAVAHGHRIVVPTNRKAQIMEKRMISGSQWAFACPAMTPEGESCLEQSTLVRLANGVEILIKDLKNGDEIQTVNPITMKESVTKIYNHFIKSSKEYGKSVYKITVIDGSSIVATEDHPFLTQQGWIFAKDLDLETHRLVRYLPNYTESNKTNYVFFRIKSIEPSPDCLISDFTTEADTHSMISNGFVTHNCGLVKEEGQSTYISLDRDDEPVHSYLKGHFSLNPEPEKQRRRSVMVNGIHVGYANTSELHRDIRNLKRSGRLYFDTGIVLDAHSDLWIWTSSGRITRPLAIVDEKSQRMMIDIKGLRDQPLDVLLENGAIEYIDAEEQLQPYIYIATKVERLREKIERKNKAYEEYQRLSIDPNASPDQKEASLAAVKAVNQEKPYTHAEIDPNVILGISASVVPLPEFMQGPRTTYQAAMGKQAMGPNTIRTELRYDTTFKSMKNPSVPFFATEAHERMGFDETPAGANVIMCILPYGGFNQEDAIIVSQRAIDLGYFWINVHHSITVSIKQSADQQEKLKFPKYSPDKAARYSKIDPETFMVRVGEIVEPGDCLVAKVIGEGKDERDASDYVEIKKRGVVESVSVTNETKNKVLIQIRLRDQRRPQAGDKFASRYSQKGVISKILPTRDMPYIVSDDPRFNGITPHIIFNPHGLPSRMTIGKLIEMLTGIYSGLAGERVNATAFRNFDPELFYNRLEELGYTNRGYERMVEGTTGRVMDAAVYIGPVYYQALKHMVVDKGQARGMGKVQFLTRQPQSGIRLKGGLRFGEMEKDALAEHGAGAGLEERLKYSSDLYEAFVCRECGKYALPNGDIGELRCTQKCPSGKFGSVKIPYIKKLMTDYLSALSINLSMRTIEKNK